MKKWLIAWIVLASPTSPCWGTTNQLEFTYGRGNPRSSVDVGYGSSQEGTHGDQWSVDILHKTSHKFYLGVGGGEYESDENVSGTFVPGALSGITSKMTSVFGLARMDFSPDPRFLTYGIVGVGWVEHGLKITSTPTSPWADTGTTEVRTIVDGKKNTLGYAAGLGIDVALGDRYIIGVEGRYQGSTNASFNTTPEGAATTHVPDISAFSSVFLVGLKAGIKY